MSQIHPVDRHRYRRQIIDTLRDGVPYPEIVRRFRDPDVPVSTEQLKAYAKRYLPLALAHPANRDRARAVLRIDKGFQEDLAAGRTASVQLIVDGVDSTTAGVVLKYGGQIAARFSRQVMVSRMRRLAGAAAGATGPRAAPRRRCFP